MYYSEQFKEKVREVYGDQYNTMLSSGSEILGRYLDDGSSNSIAISTVLAATSLEELKKMAKKAQGKQEVYKMWSDQYRKTLGY